ncbi:MAG: methyltransferase domain-containing protein [Cyclobacteriaceae bacterium]|nr:methyltransferase domain-containing protein [Cyclobacteriaceae bacterium]
MNEKKHWDQLAPEYNNEIFDAYASDKFKKLPRYINKHGSPIKTAIDFGCGNGKSFPYLAPAFKSVLGVDISKRLLKQAAALNFKNVTLKAHDVTRKPQVPKADFAFCCNVVMFPDFDKNIKAFQNIARALKPGGTALLVLPSLDSALFSAWQLIQMYKNEGVKAAHIPAHEFHFKGNMRNILQGIVHIDNVPTKHYSASELEVILPQAGFTITNLEKLEYDWNTELANPPKNLGAPYPWDWLVEVRA